MAPKNDESEDRTMSDEEFEAMMQRLEDGLDNLGNELAEINENIQNEEQELEELKQVLQKLNQNHAQLKEEVDYDAMEAQAMSKNYLNEEMEAEIYDEMEAQAMSKDYSSPELEKLHQHELNIHTEVQKDIDTHLLTLKEFMAELKKTPEIKTTKWDMQVSEAIAEELQAPKISSIQKCRNAINQIDQNLKQHGKLISSKCKSLLTKIKNGLTAAVQKVSKLMTKVSNSSSSLFSSMKEKIKPSRNDYQPIGSPKVKR